MFVFGSYTVGRREGKGKGRSMISKVYPSAREPAVRARVHWTIDQSSPLCMWLLGETSRHRACSPDASRWTIRCASPQRFLSGVVDNLMYITDQPTYFSNCYGPFKIYDSMLV